MENNRGEEGKCVSGTSEAPMNECTEACNYHIKMESIRTFKVMFEILPYVFLLGFARVRNCARRKGKRTFKSQDHMNERTRVPSNMAAGRIFLKADSLSLKSR